MNVLNLITFFKLKSLYLYPMTLPELIAKHKLNKAELARKMNMPLGTFVNKALDQVKPYHFTEEESKKLLAILKEMCKDIKEVKI